MIKLQNQSREEMLEILDKAKVGAKIRFYYYDDDTEVVGYLITKSDINNWNLEGKFSDTNNISDLEIIDSVIQAMSLSIVTTYPALIEREVSSEGLITVVAEYIVTVIETWDSHDRFVKENGSIILHFDSERKITNREIIKKAWLLHKKVQKLHITSIHSLSENKNIKKQQQ